MNGRGLDPRARRIGWMLVAVAIAALYLASGPAALERAGGWLESERERLPWYATRLLGLLSWLAIAGSVIWGLLLSTGILDAIAHRAVSFTLHQDLSAYGLGLALVHAAILMIDRSVPYSPLELLVPFAGPYRPIWVGIGQVTLYLTIVVLGSFYVRKRIGQKRWRTLHYLSFLAFVGATVHGLMAGTDTAAPLIRWAYAIAGAIVAFLFVYRIVLAVAARAFPQATLPTTRTPRTVVPAQPAAPPPAGAPPAPPAS